MSASGRTMKPSILTLSIAALAFGGQHYLPGPEAQGRARTLRTVRRVNRARSTRASPSSKRRVPNRYSPRRERFGAVSMPPGQTMRAMPPPPSPRPRNEQMPAKPAVVEAYRPSSLRAAKHSGKMMRAQIRAQEQAIYADVGAQLGLSKEETSKLIDLLTDQHVDGIGVSRETSDPDRTHAPDERRAARE